VARDLGFRHRERPLALARSHKEKAYVGSMLVNLCCRLEQRRDTLLASETRYSDDDLGRAQPQRLTNLTTRP
jgi:hypothetical protein